MLSFSAFQSNLLRFTHWGGIPQHCLGVQGWAAPDTWQLFKAAPSPQCTLPPPDCTGNTKGPYVLRTAPSFRSPILASFDCVLRSHLESICNICLSDQSWSQASLPIHLEGLDIRSVTMLAPSAFLVSTAGTYSVVLAILPPTFSPTPCTHQEEALRLWESSSGSTDPPTRIHMCIQKAWDTPVASALAANHTTSANPIAKAHL